jgi:hypothetical protein
MRYLYYGIWLSIAISFLCIYSIGNTQTVTTGNLLPNSNDGVDWGSSSTDQINPGASSGYVTNNSNLNGFDITCPTTQSNCGYKYSVGGDFEVTGTATVSADDIKLYSNTITQSMLDNGVTLDSHVDVANCESTQGNCESKGGANDSHTTTVTLKDNSGNTLSTVSQTRTEVTGFQGNCNGYPGSSGAVATACGQYNDRIIYLGVGANNVDWSWTGTDSNYSNQSRQGPNLLGAKLTMTYNDTEYNPIDEDVIEDIEDIVENIPDDFDWINEDITEIPDFSIPEEEFTIPFEEDFYFEEIVIDDLPPIEEFDMEVFQEMPDMEVVFFEEEFSEPIMVTEEIFTEEFEEDFTEFLEETGMEEEFMEFLEDEGITAEEFFEEITEEEFNDELTEESFEEFEEPLEDISTEEESVPEVEENETETMEEVTESEPVEEEKEVATNETTKEEEPDSTESEDSEVSTEDSGEQEDIQSEEVDTKDRVATDVAKVETKLKNNLKIIAKQIAKITKETTQNLTKEDLFFKNDTLDAYTKTQFYKSKDIYTDQGIDLFNQIDLSIYDKNIYSGVTLASYTQNDPVEVHRVQLQKAQNKTNQLELELEAMKNENN